MKDEQELNQTIKRFVENNPEILETANAMKEFVIDAHDAFLRIDNSFKKIASRIEKQDMIIEELSKSINDLEKEIG